MNDKRQRAFELFRQGKRGVNIARILGVDMTTVYKWRSELIESGWVAEETKATFSLPENFHIRWAVAVNRIRRYCGKEEFEMPIIEEEKKIIRCSECGYTEFVEGNGRPNRYFCIHPGARFAKSECEPTPMICLTERHSKEMKMKTSPKWCPRKEKEPETVDAGTGGNHGRNQ